MAKKKGSTTAQLNTALTISDTILTVVQDAARVSPIPYLQEAAGLALGIIDIVQSTMDNKEAFNRLAADACGLVYAVLCTHQEKNTISVGLLDNARDLLTTLASIERFAKKQASRSLFLRTVHRKSDVGRIQEYRDNLKQSLDVFGLQSSIGIQENIARISARQETLLEELQEREAERRAREEAESNRVAQEAREREAREKAREKHEREEKEQIERENLERERLESQRLALEKDIREQIMKEQEREKLEAERRESQRLALEREVRAKMMREQGISDRENARRHEEERAQRASLGQQAQSWPLGTETTYTPPTTPPYPHRPSQQPSSLYKYFRDGSKITTIYGDQVTTGGSTNITNTNSGNTDSNNITGSYNDSSVRAQGTPRRPRNKVTRGAGI